MELGSEAQHKHAYKESSFRRLIRRPDLRDTC
jgi:hypothetical protein